MTNAGINMNLKAAAKTALKKLDRLSPYPLLYPFVMSEKEKAIFDKAIKRSRHYLEFGLGGSTLRAIQRSKAMIYTVESSAEWIHDMREYRIVRHAERVRLCIFPVDIGPVVQWGFPGSDTVKHAFEAYSSKFFQSFDSRMIDLVLVDGRFRVACALKTVLACRDNDTITILIHDFWDRPYYHVVLKYLDTIDRVDTLGVFSIKKEVDLRSAANDYELYKGTPD